MSLMEKEEKRWLLILAVIAVTFNAITLSPLIPWQNWLFWARVTPTKEYRIHMGDYQFHLPAGGIVVKAGEPVKFVVTSGDVTYGFGVFRKSGQMIFQIQVIPTYENTITWIFDEPGDYTIRSTEYSGPNHPYMVVPNAIRVVS